MPARLMPLPNVALVDQRSGVMDQNWYDYFLKNAQDLTALQTTVTALQATVTALQATVAALTPQLIKAWASVDVDTGTGVATITSSYNIASIVNSGTGKFIVVLTTPYAVDTDWVGFACPNRGAAGTDLFGGIRDILDATSVELVFADGTNRVNPDNFFFAALGNLTT